LFGNLILDIAINTDGTIRSFNIARSSGHKILDDAAWVYAILSGSSLLSPQSATESCHEE